MTHCFEPHLSDRNLADGTRGFEFHGSAMALWKRVNRFHTQPVRPDDGITDSSAGRHEAHRGGSDRALFTQVQRGSNGYVD